MGSWNETCGVTQLPILDGDPVVLFLLTQVPSNELVDAAGHCYSTDVWSPRFIQIYGKYDDYGRIQVSDPEDWNLQFLVERLRKDAVPMEQGKNEYHDLAVVPDELTFDNVQELMHEGRLFVNVNALMRATEVGIPEKTSIGYMMVHQFVFDEAIRFEYDHFRGSITLKSVIESGLKWCENYKSKATKDEMMRELFKSNLRYEIGNTFGELADYGNILVSRDGIYQYIDHLFEMIFGGATQSEIDKYIIELSKFYMFSTFMTYTRKTFAPQAGKGSQSQEYDVHKMLAEKMLKHIKEREAEFEAW